MSIDRILDAFLEFYEARKALKTTEAGPDYIRCIGRCGKARAEAEEAISEAIRGFLTT